MVLLTRRFPMARRVVKYTAGAAIVTGTAIMIPPMEMLPNQLLPVRIVMEGIARLLRCGYVGIGVLFDYKWNLRSDDSQAAWDEVHTRSAKKLVMLAETNGGLYVKAGQGFAAMNHILPQAYCKVMQTLQNAVLTRPYSESAAVIEADLQRPIEEVFESIEPTPIAAASIAQVHKAKLKDSGKEVAVKVQYMDIRHRFTGDVGTINLCFAICGMAFPGYDFSTLITRTQDIMEAELDFIAEAKNSDKCGELMKPVFGTDAVTPNVEWRFTTKRVLVTEFINGCKVTDLEGLRRLGVSPKFCSKTLVRVFAHQLFSTGFVHADPHPGNILVHKVNGKPQLVVLDHGLYVTIDDEQRSFVSRLWTAMTTQNTPELAAICKSVGVSDYVLFASMFLQHPYDAFDPFKARATAADLDVMRWHAATQMESITEMLEALPKEYALVLRNINTVRSVNKELGNPVSRTAEMLRYSLKTSHHDDMLTRWSMLAKLWFNESKEALVMWYVAWRHPEVLEMMDELFEMG